MFQFDYILPRSACWLINDQIAKLFPICNHAIWHHYDVLTKRFALWRNLDQTFGLDCNFQLHLYISIAACRFLHNGTFCTMHCATFLTERQLIESTLIALSKNFPRTLPRGKTESLFALEMLSGSGVYFVVALVVVVR